MRPCVSLPCSCLIVYHIQLPFAFGTMKPPLLLLVLLSISTHQVASFTIQRYTAPGYDTSFGYCNEIHYYAVGCTACRHRTYYRRCVTKNRWSEPIFCDPGAECGFDHERYEAVCCNRAKSECQDQRVRCIDRRTIKVCKFGKWSKSACPTDTECRTYGSLYAECDKPLSRGK